MAQQPPFERSELSQFRDDMIRAMKYINHASNRYVVYEFPSSDKEMRELAPLIYEACVEISKAIKSLSRDRNIEPYRLAVNQLEAKADDIYHEGLRRRFREIREDRAELAYCLIRSLDEGDDPGIQSAWEAELERRWQEMESGKVVGEPAESVFARMRKKYS